jgi:hypothetical protein
MACGEIDRGSNVSCDLIPIGGTEPVATVINWDDLDDDAPFAYGSAGNITAINMKPGKVAYQFFGYKKVVTYINEVIASEMGPNKFKTTTGFAVYERTQAQKNNIKKLARGRFVFITQLKGQDADAIVVQGSKTGLEIVPAVIQDAHANDGYFVFSFANLEGENENELPLTLGTSFANAVAIIDELLTS